MESLGLYLDADAKSLAGLSKEDFILAFRSSVSYLQNREEKVVVVRADAFSQIAKKDAPPSEHYVLQPTSGTWVLAHESRPDQETPSFTARMSFQNLDFVLDDKKLRSVISMLETIQISIRQPQHNPYRPSWVAARPELARARFLFAIDAIVRERRTKARWTLGLIEKRREERQRYQDLYTRSALKQDNAGALDTTVS